MHEGPQPDHLWLHKLVGQWTFETEATMAPGQPPVKFAGTESVRSLGDVWVLCEGKGQMPGGGMTTTLMTLGFDPLRKRYVGSFIGSMMTHLWLYDGERDASGAILTLESVGPSLAGDGTMIKYRDVIEIRGDDHRLLTSLTPAEDGSWHTFMTGNYRRIPHDGPSG